MFPERLLTWQWDLVECVCSWLTVSRAASEENTTLLSNIGLIVLTPEELLLQKQQINTSYVNIKMLSHQYNLVILYFRLICCLTVSKKCPRLLCDSFHANFTYRGHTTEWNSMSTFQGVTVQHDVTAQYQSYWGTPFSVLDDSVKILWTRLCPNLKWDVLHTHLPPWRPQPYLLCFYCEDASLPVLALDGRERCWAAQRQSERGDKRSPCWLVTMDNCSDLLSDLQYISWPCICFV